MTWKHIIRIRNHGQNFQNNGLRHMTFGSKVIFFPKSPLIRALPGYEKCQASDIILNFFIARTLTAGTVRMDGLFKQIAHREYFLDGIGKLRIAVW